MQPIIFKDYLDRPFTKDERQSFVKYVRNVANIEAQIGNAKTKYMSVLSEPELTDIKSFCLNSLYKYTNNTDIEITQSWLYFSMPGESLHSINHPNSFISGIFYVNARIALHNIVFSEIEETISTGRGDLLLFPSNLLHHEPKNTGNDLKISIGFNTTKPIK